MDPTDYDHPPDAGEIRRSLESAYPFDPYRLGSWSAHMERCGRTRIHTFDGRYRDNAAMCQQLGCLLGACSRWKIDHPNNEHSYRAMYDAMPQPIFSGSQVVACQPFPLTPAHFGAKGKISQRLKTKGGLWTRLTVFTPDPQSYVVFVFTDGTDVSQRDDEWRPWRLTADDARALLLEVLLQPGVLAHKPTASAGPWRLPADPVKEARSVRLGSSRSQEVSTRVLDRAEAKLAAKKRRLRDTGGPIQLPKALELELGRSSYESAWQELSVQRE